MDFYFLENILRKIFPKKLRPGDGVRIIAPARSLALLSEESKRWATTRLEAMGLKVSFGDHCIQNDAFNSSSIEHRLQDFHQAFADKSVACVLTAIGGFNSNQLLQYIDWNLVASNAKIFCGFSDITALNNAIFAMTGLVSYSGPNYANFGQKHLSSYTLDYFKKCLFSSEPFEIKASKYWSDFEWGLHPENDQRIVNSGWKVVNDGDCEGTIIGGNLCTLNLLNGTKYFPDIRDSVLFLEDDELVSPAIFDRDLQSLIHQPNFPSVRGLVIGRFQQVSRMDFKLLEQIIKSKNELRRIPIVANADFGHTEPKFTFPAGGYVRLSAGQKRVNIEVVKH